MYEEYDEGEQSHAQAEGGNRRTHYVRVHKAGDQPENSNQTKKNGAPTNGTTTPGATNSGSDNLYGKKGSAGGGGEEDPTSEKDHANSQSSA